MCGILCILIYARNNYSNGANNKYNNKPAKWLHMSLYGGYLLG